MKISFAVFLPAFLLVILGGAAKAAPYHYDPWHGPYPAIKPPYPDHGAAAILDATDGGDPYRSPHHGRCKYPPCADGE